jgi:hypothetical protein
MVEIVLTSWSEEEKRGRGSRACFVLSRLGISSIFFQLVVCDFPCSSEFSLFTFFRTHASILLVFSSFTSLYLLSRGNDLG